MVRRARSSDRGAPVGTRRRPRSARFAATSKIRIARHADLPGAPRLTASRPRWLTPIPSAFSDRSTSVIAVGSVFSCQQSTMPSSTRSVGMRSPPSRPRACRGGCRRSRFTSRRRPPICDQRSGFVAAAIEVAVTVGALGDLVTLGHMNLLSAGGAVKIARLLSAFTGLGGHLGSPSTC